jgi:hypothetical protein
VFLLKPVLRGRGAVTKYSDLCLKVVGMPKIRAVIGQCGSALISEMDGINYEKEQAGAELFQAQVKMGLASLTVTSNKLSGFPLTKY